MKFRLGAVCALAGALAISVGISAASAGTLNGYMEFGTAGVTYGGGTSLGSAAWIKLPTTTLVMGPQDAVSPVNGVVNNFDYNSANPWSFQALSIIGIDTHAAGNKIPTTFGIGAPYIGSFLTFASDGPTAAFPILGTGLGTSPAYRFTYDISLASWASSGPGELDLTTSGFLMDTGLPGFVGQPASLTLSLTSACSANAIDCGRATGAWEFYTLGDGNYVLTPEPAALSVLGLGLVALAMVRRRR